MYRAPSKERSEQILNAHVMDDALLVILPDPVTCFAEARYAQRQTLNLSTSSSLVLLDWCTSGRVSRGESWDMDEYRSLNNIIVEETEVFWDQIKLERPEPGTPLSELSITKRMVESHVMATLVVIEGTMLEETGIVDHLLYNLHQKKVAPYLCDYSQDSSNRKRRRIGMSDEEEEVRGGVFLSSFELAQHSILI